MTCKCNKCDKCKHTFEPIKPVKVWSFCVPGNKALCEWKLEENTFYTVDDALEYISKQVVSCVIDAETNRNYIYVYGTFHSLEPTIYKIER